MEHGTLTLRINDILKLKTSAKNQIYKDLDIPHTYFNRYCRNEFQRLDVGLICKLCHYLNVGISELITYNPPSQ